MEIYINEKKETVEENTLFKIRDKFKSDADIIILNGFPIKEDKSFTTFKQYFINKIILYNEKKQEYNMFCNKILKG